MRYYISWSPKSGECTFTRVFFSEIERETFKRRINGTYKSVFEWEN